ncbi:MAG: patatin-like phospholipase family protein, partial [Bacteriovorax sp.]
FAVKTELNVDHIMGSSAIPLFFPPSKIGESYYGDGCIRQITPLSPAIDLGATKIITIGIRNQQPVSLMKEISFKANKSPQISQVAGIMMDAIFLDSLESDVERLKKVNTITEMMGNKSPWRNIPILSLSPSRDLGLMTEKLSSEMPLMLRYFLRSIGVTGQSGLDLLSYLAFDSSYTTRVTELGYEDTMAKKKEILNFIDS